MARKRMSIKGRFGKNKKGSKSRGSTQDSGSASFLPNDYNANKFNPEKTDSRIPTIYVLQGNPTIQRVTPVGDAGRPGIWTSFTRDLLATSTSLDPITGSIAVGGSSVSLALNAGGSGTLDVPVVGLRIYLSPPTNSETGILPCTINISGFDMKTGAAATVQSFRVVWDKLDGAVELIKFFSKSNPLDYNRGRPLQLAARASDASNLLTVALSGSVGTSLEIEPIYDAMPEFLATAEALGITI